jgi:2-C-methyl-D-erythritol 4-phosphate cytidylyltransferase
MQFEGVEASAGATRRAAAVLVADGDGGRRSSYPRAFARAGDTTLLELCTGTLDRCDEIEAFVVVVPVGMEDRVAGAARMSPKFVAAVPGGASHGESVTAGVAALPTHLHAVVCHEIARPLASEGLFASVLQALERADAAVPGVPVGDTVKEVEGGVVRATIPRSGLWTLQTPRAFRREALVAVERAGLGEAENPGDVLWSFQRAGRRVVTVAGESTNIRVSSREDLRLVESLLAHRRGSEHGR